MGKNFQFPRKAQKNMKTNQKLKMEKIEIKLMKKFSQTNDKSFKNRFGFFGNCWSNDHYIRKKK